MFSRTGLALVGLFAAVLPFPSRIARGQTAQTSQTGVATLSVVRGTVADPDAAVIPGAAVTLTPSSGKALLTQSQSDGSYALNGVSPGTYSLTITMPNFATFVRQGIRIGAGQALTVNVKMAIQEADQVVQVTAQANTLSVDQDSNASSTVIKGKDLEALSDDPDELSSELTALAGPAAGPNGGQIYVDGFTGGQLPPKSSIREIRVNQNPFSAQYDRLGYGRVEVFTKPGTDKFHGQAQLNANDSHFNTANPLLNQSLQQGQSPIVQPPYHTLFFFGNVTGPLARSASFTVGGSRRQIQDNALVNGIIAADPSTPTTLCQPGDGNLNCKAVSYQAAISVPQTRWDITPRLDLALGDKNTLTARYQYESNNQVNNGVGSLVLQSAGSTSASTEQEIQISDTQIISPRVINETRFEFGRDTGTVAANSTAPNISVQGSFTAGGSGAGSSNDTQHRIEVQNYTSLTLSKNFVRFGGRLRHTAESNTTTNGTNGVFTYSSVADYLSDNPSQFAITKVNNGVDLSYTDLEVYAEDDWKVRPNLTFSYGLRYEVQNFVSEHHDFGPRVSFAYGLGSARGNPKTVLRGGFGIFYDRFQLNNQLTTVEENGLNQVRSTAVFEQGQGTNGCSPGNVAACQTSLATGGNQTYSANPHLRSPYTMQFAIGADQQLFRGATISVNYLSARGVHQFVSENINAPLPGTTTGNINRPILAQFESAGVFRQNQVLTNFNLRGSRHFSVFGFYALNFAKSDTAGATSFASNSYDLGADYGRANFDTRSRLFLGGNVSAPHFLSISPFIIAASGSPYNVTTGTDVNGDSLFIDRPSFANGKSGRCTVAADFVVPPTGASYTPIPVNYCTGPALFTMNLRVAKTFGFGKLTDAAAARAGAAAQGGPPQGGPGRGGPGGGGRGGPGGFGGGTASTGRRYNLALGLQAQNLFNFHDYASPIGTLGPQQRPNPNFGRTLQLAGGPYTTNSATERLQLFLSFGF